MLVESLTESVEREIKKKRRMDIAKAALTGLCGNAYISTETYKPIAETAVALADALIEALQFNGENK